MVNRILIALTLVFLFATSVAAQGDEQPERFPFSILLRLRLGAVDRRQPPAKRLVFVTITAPADYGAVSGTAFTVSGEGAGLFEGNVIVEVRADGGDVLFTGSTTLQVQEVGQQGTWSIDIDLRTLAGATLCRRRRLFDLAGRRIDDRS